MPGPLANPLAPPHSLCSSDKDHIRDTPPPGRCTAQQEISGSEKVGIEHVKCLQLLDFGEFLWTQDFADHRDECALRISKYVDYCWLENLCCAPQLASQAYAQLEKHASQAFIAWVNCTMSASMSCKSCRSAEDLASSKGSPATGEPPQLQCTAAQLQCVQHEIAIATIEGLRKESGSTEATCFAQISMRASCN